MQKEQLLNSLGEEAREALENAKRLALSKGGKLTPLHLMVAVLEYLMAISDQVGNEPGRLLQTARDVLSARFPTPYQGASITITKATQQVISEANEIAKAEGELWVAPLQLLQAAMESADVKEALFDAKLCEMALGDIAFQSLSLNNCAKQNQHPPTTSPHDSAAPQERGTNEMAKSQLTGVLAQFCSNLAEESLITSAHQFVGREREMTAVLETLCRKLKNNPLLIGKPGVGKTALVTAVATRLREGHVPPRLQGKRVLEVSRLRLLADAKYSGDIEERLKQLIEEVKRAGDVLLFFDEIHTLLNAGGAGGVGDIANLLKSSLSKGEITCIGATTLSEYYKYIARDEALARRFSTITIEEPSVEETKRILLEARVAFESHHDIKIDDTAVALIVDLADRYLQSRSFPDKAFDLMDKAAAKATLAGEETLLRECVTEALSETTGLPLEIMNENPAERLERLEAFLNAMVPGQARASRDIARVVRLAKLRLELRPERPDGVFLFVGVEGAGKHEMASALAKFLYGSSKKMIDFDMSQFTEPWSLARLIGAEPGYVGYGERSGLLSKAAEDNPHSVLYFRNLDLAHPVVQQFLGEAFEQGSFTDATGARISLSNTTVIMSLSQISENSKHTPVGFYSSPEDQEARPITGNLKFTGSLRLRERGSAYSIIEPLAAAIDEVIEFQVLDRAAIERIIAERLDALKIRLEAAQPVTVHLDATLVRFFADKLTSERKSLAQLERIWQETILIPFTNLHAGKRQGGARVEIAISVESNGVQVAIENDSL